MYLWVKGLDSFEIRQHARIMGNIVIRECNDNETLKVLFLSNLSNLSSLAGGILVFDPQPETDLDHLIRLVYKISRNGQRGGGGATQTL